MNRRFPSIITAVNYWKRMGKRGVLVGMCSDRIPMIEFECEASKLCVQGLRDPLRIANWQESCEYVFREAVAPYFGYQLAFAAELYKISTRPEWEKATCPTKVGVRKVPFVFNVADKSLHAVGMVCLPRDWYPRFYGSLLGVSLQCVDQAYIEAVVNKKYATLRVVPKTLGRERVTEWHLIKSIVVGEFVVENLKPRVVVYKLYRPAWDFVNHVFVAIRQFGIDVEILGFRARL